MQQKIISALNEMSELYLICDDEYRSQAYFMAALNIKKAPPTTDYSNIPGIGISIREFINEISRGDMSKLNNIRAVADQYRELGKIFGVGKVTIKKWISIGITSVDKLRIAVRKGKVVLNKMQNLGLKYYIDLNTPIPRNEVNDIGNTAATVAPCIVAGSYRRGAKYSNDVDILMMEPATTIVSKLQDKFDVIALFGGKERITMLVNYYGICRHIDIIIATDINCALLYFTGDYRFNIMMRGRAKSLGYKLNQHGLFRDGVRTEVKSEREIFELLGLEYKEPPARIMKV